MPLPSPALATSSPEAVDRLPAARRSFRCRCGQPLFFRNSVCVVCHAELGYEPWRAQVRALHEAGDGLWQLHLPGSLAIDEAAGRWRRCANFTTAAGCNWLVAEHDGNPLCRCCRLNRTIPDQSDADNRLWWGRVEMAKRRLVSLLIALRLPVASRLTEDPARGLAFDVLRDLPGQPVLTGHADGIVTLNVEEADDARRESTRRAFEEPYRTLLGHLRHEVGHYYWQRLVDGTPWLEGFRQVFGDEREDYRAALARHYEQGAPADWLQRHVSAYASAHPWEDWAETWAHYLHMIDTLDTAQSFELHSPGLGIEPFGSAVLWPGSSPAAEPGEDAAFLAFVNTWIALTGVLNELCRAMGQPDFYPFVLGAAAVRKLHFVHRVVGRARS